MHNSRSDIDMIAVCSSEEVGVGHFAALDGDDAVIFEGIMSAENMEHALAIGACVFVYSVQDFDGLQEFAGRSRPN